MIFSWVLIDIAGRRVCSLTGLALQFAAHIYMSIYMGLQPSSSRSTTASNAAIASVFVYAVGWSVGLCTMPFLYGTEIFCVLCLFECPALVLSILCCARNAQHV